MLSHVFNSKKTVPVPQEHHLNTLKYWSIITAYGLAAAEGVRLTQEHIDILLWLRTQFDQQGSIDSIQVMQQLAVMYGPDGGEDYLHILFPKDPVVQSLRIAGLPVPEYQQDNLQLVS